MKIRLRFLFLASCFLALFSCNQSSNKIPVLGEIDSLAIAQDTAMQMGLEVSYEYSKTLVIHDKLVYDIVGYGGTASKGEYAIIRRGADNKADTMAVGIRDGRIQNAFVADLNRNKLEEVYLVTTSVGSGGYGKLIAYEAVPDGKFNPIGLEEVNPVGTGGGIYMGHDSIYLRADKLIGREFPLYKMKDPNCCPTGGKMNVVYELSGSKLVISKAAEAK